MTRKPSLALIRKARREIARLDPEVRLLISELLDRVEPRRRPGRKPSKTKPGRDFQVVQSYQQLVDERQMVQALLRGHPEPELRDWLNRLPRNRHERYEAIASDFGLRAKTVQNIIEKQNKSVRAKRSRIRVGID